jgi:hypothetical protein
MSIKDWGDAKLFLFEDIVIYLIAIILNVFSDFIINLFIATGIQSGELHPYNFGLFQSLILLFLLLQLVRKLNHWKYWS